MSEFETAEAETFENVRYTADVVCIRGESVLLIERGWDPHRGLLALPGGHVDPGETSLAAAVRELWEETGVRVAPATLTLVGLYDAPGRDPRGRYVTAAYVVDVPEDTKAVAGDDAAAVRWVPLADLPGALAFDHGQILADARRRRPAVHNAITGWGDDPHGLERALTALSLPEYHDLAALDQVERAKILRATAYLASELRHRVQSLTVMAREDGMTWGTLASNLTGNVHATSTAQAVYEAGLTQTGRAATN